MVKSETKSPDMKCAKDESTTTKNGTISKEKKRKRKDPNGKQEWQEDQERYYNRLLHAAKKALRKESKVVRNFECQKMVRKIKERKKERDVAPGAGINANIKMGLALAEETYQQMKNLDLDRVMNESLRRLGILHLDPKLLEEAKRVSEAKAVNNNDNHQDDNGNDDDSDDDDSDDDDSDNDDARRESKPIMSEKEQNEHEHLVERILKHKKMQSALEHWNEQVTEYRRWCLRQQERDSQPYGLGGGTSNNHQPSPAKKHKKTKMQMDHPEATVGATNSSTGISAQKSLFVKLGDQGDRVAQGGGDGQDLHYGPGSSIVAEGRKKNRKGQRARRAKAIAIEAKLAGRVHRPDDSLNWRPKKQQETIDEDNDFQNKNRSSLSRAHQKQQTSSGRPERSGEMATKSTEALHPSWAAAKKEPTGIVEFKGKKIIF